MQLKISKIMLRRTVLPAVLVILLGVTLWAFKRNDNDGASERADVINRHWNYT